MMFDFFFKKSKSDRDSKEPIGKPKFSEIKKRSRILIIDDGDFEYKSLFERDGYSIDKWTKNEDIDQDKLDSHYYDIILLDINGVATDRTTEHGFGLLEYIKEKNPAQIVIIYSASLFGISAYNYAKLADDCLDKSSDYYNFKKIIDKHLENCIDLQYYVNVLKSITQKEGIDFNSIEKEFRSAIENKKEQMLRQKLETMNISFEIVEKIFSIVEKGSNIIGG